MNLSPGPARVNLTSMTLGGKCVGFSETDSMFEEMVLSLEQEQR